MRYLIALLSLLAVANAQFGGFFDQMFGSDDGHAGHGRGHHSSNSPSDASHYRHRYESCTSKSWPHCVGCIFEKRVF